ncbi:MFS transporter [Spirillospora sp. NPDC050679]
MARRRLGSDFGKLWTAATLSGLGDGVTLIAGPLLAASLTGDPVRVAALMVAQQLPWLLFALPGGALVDRLDRRRLMTSVSLLRVLALGGLALAVASGDAGLPVLYGVFFMVGCAGLLFENAAATAVPALVEPAHLERANGRLQASRVLGEQLVAKPLGGWLFAVAAWTPFLLDAAGLLIVAALAAALPASVNTASAPAGERRTLRGSIGEGVAWLWRHRLLRTLAITVGTSNVGLAATSAVLVLIARDRFGVGAVGFGALLAVLAVGGAAGGLLAGRIAAALGPGTTLRAGLVVEGAVYVGAALTRDVVVAGVLVALLGLHLVLFSAIVASLRQSLAPPEMLGRVHSAYRVVTNAGMLLGAAAGGLLARYLGLAAPLWLGAACVALLVAGVWRVLNDQDIRAARESRASG